MIKRSYLGAVRLILIALASSTLSSFALAKEAPLFTETEIRLHGDRIGLITSTASSCLTDIYADHLEFYKRWGVSKYYGNRLPEHQTEAGRRGELIRYNAPESLVTELQPISCIGLTIRCLREGFDAAGMSSTWDKVHAKLSIGNNFYGTDLMVMLRELGWKIYYWNPDPSQNAAWDAEDRVLAPLAEGKTWNPIWGGHAYHYAMSTTGRGYYGIPVDDATTLVGFKTTTPQALVDAPFLAGIAHAGFHVFPGLRGQIIEAHSKRRLDAIENLEMAPFNPLAPSGAPRWSYNEKYRSGVIALPPVAREKP